MKEYLNGIAYLILELAAMGMILFTSAHLILKSVSFIIETLY